MGVSRMVLVGALALSLGCIEEHVELSIEYFAITPDVTQAGALVEAEIEVVGADIHGHDHSHEGGQSHHHGEGGGSHVHLFIDDVNTPAFATMSSARVKVELPGDLGPGLYTVIALLHDHGEEDVYISAEADLEIVE